jgi:CRISPR-associated protein Csm4
MKLYRLKLKPLSPWRTPWQADTLAGMLCWACARAEDGAALRREILEPAARGAPPFVLSDAFPGDLLPIPEFVRLQAWPQDRLKAVRKARWMTSEAFRRAQSGQSVSLDALVTDDPFKPHSQTRNMIDRLTDTTGAGGHLFTLPENWLGEKSAGMKQTPYLSLYVRVAPGFEDRLIELIGELAHIGFGADASVGKGQFDPVSGLEPIPQLDEVESPNGVIALSTFQPNADDPTGGGWQAFTKFGKLGPDFGLENVFKRPLVMLRPGAFFRSKRQPLMLGRIIPMDQLLSQDVCQQLRAEGAEIAHLAFGLTVPVHFPAGF